MPSKLAHCREDALCGTAFSMLQDPSCCHSIWPRHQQRFRQDIRHQTVSCWNGLSWRQSTREFLQRSSRLWQAVSPLSPSGELRAQDAPDMLSLPLYRRCHRTGSSGCIQALSSEGRHTISSGLPCGRSSSHSGRTRIRISARRETFQD